MPILKSISTPNGATATYHRVVSVEGRFPDLVVNVQSFADRDAFIAGKPPLTSTPVPYAAGELLDELEAGALLHENFAGGYIDSATDETVEVLKTRQWAKLMTHRDGLMYAPIPYQDYAVNADMDSQVKMLGAILMLQTSTDLNPTKVWRCSDNVMRPLTLPDIFGIGVAISNRTQSLIDITDALWQRMTAATDEETVLAIHWPDAPLPDDEPPAES
jgi:hypothetical protein